MNNESAYITIGSQQLHYLQWGSGSKLLLAFHGYGNDAAIFSPLKSYLASQYTILSFDLPHHGNSKWDEDVLLTKKDIVDLADKLKAKYNVSKLSLMGYSMGGRLCMSIIEAMPSVIDKVVLLAADGLAINMYYYFLTRTWLGKNIFRNLLEKPAPYFKLLNQLKKRKVIPESRHKFVSYFLQSAQSRNFLLRVWVGMSDHISRPAKIKAIIKKHAIPVYIIMGAYDKVMPPAFGERFKDGLDSVQLLILEKGHRVFDSENAAQIAGVLL